MPISERQQLKWLEQQQEAEALAAAGTPVEEEETKRTRRDSRRKQPTKKEKLSLDERKQLAREMAKKRAEEEAKEETNEESSEAEFGEDKPAPKKRRLTEDDPDRDEEASLNENLNEDADEPTGKSKPPERFVRKETKRQAAFSDDSDSQEKKNGKAIDEDDKMAESKTEADSAIQRKGSIPRRPGGIPKKTEISRDVKPSSLLTNLKPASTSIHPTIASIRTKTMKPLPTTSTKLPRSGDASLGPRIVVSHIPSSTGAAPIAPVHLPAWNSGEAPNIERRTPPPPQTHTGKKDPHVLKALHALCESLNKDNRFQIRTGPAVDMSGSFLSDERYDFFDLDDAGDILFPAKIPIFPEDFPPGMPEWPLYWWGIIDPALAPAPSTPKESEELIRSQERRHEPPSPHLHPLPPHFRPEGGAHGRGRGRSGGWGRGGRGAPPPFHGAPPPFHGTPPPLHGGLSPSFPSPVAPRGRGARPGDWRPPESDWRPSGPPPDRR